MGIFLGEPGEKSWLAGNDLPITPRCWP